MKFKSPKSGGKKGWIISLFPAIFTNKKTSQKKTKNGVLRDENDGKFTVSGKFYWQKKHAIEMMY